MNTVCYCNDCYSRRFRLGPDSVVKFDDCEIQQALDYAYAQNAKSRVALEEQLCWALYEGKQNG